jgi:hypothetical protein
MSQNFQLHFLVVITQQTNSQSQCSLCRLRVRFIFLTAPHFRQGLLQVAITMFVGVLRHPAVVMKEGIYSCNWSVEYGIDCK